MRCSSFGDGRCNDGLHEDNDGNSNDNDNNDNKDDNEDHTEKYNDDSDNDYDSDVAEDTDIGESCRRNGEERKWRSMVRNIEVVLQSDRQRCSLKIFKSAINPTSSPLRFESLQRVF
jgi:hypothetical protein